MPNVCKDMAAISAKMKPYYNQPNVIYDY